MKVFKFVNHDVSLTDEVFLYPVFKKILKKYKGLEDAINEFKYIFFMADFRSDFDDIIDEKEKSKMIIKTVIASDAFKLKLDKVTEEAIEFYRERQMTTSLHLLNDAKLAIFKVRQYLKNVDLEITDANGKPLHDIKKLTDTIAATPKLIAALSSLEEQVKRELDEGSRVRGGQIKSFFEDPE